MTHLFIAVKQTYHGGVQKAHENHGGLQSLVLLEFLLLDSITVQHIGPNNSLEQKTKVMTTKIPK